jgi:hypothetical protein
MTGRRPGRNHLMLSPFLFGRVSSSLVWLSPGPADFLEAEIFCIL